MERRRFLTTTALAGLPFVSRAEPVKGSYLTPDSPEYDVARGLFNSDLDMRPTYIARCRDGVEVAKAIRFAREEGLAVSVKSGGHCFIGSSMANGSLAIDLGVLSQRAYLPDSRKLVAGPGVKLGSLYDTLLPQGRLLPAGSCSGVGLGGLTLGGGYGLFARQWGLTCDHLTRVKMVGGRGREIDSEQDEDLLWACRGGGNGNFGAIISMEFNTRAAPKTFAAQRFLAKGLNSAKVGKLMEGWFGICEDLAEPLFSAFVLNGNQISILLTSSYPSSGKAFQATTKALLQLGLSTKGASNSPTAKALKRYYGRPDPLPFYNLSGGYYRSFDDLASSCDFVSQKVLSTPGLIFQVNTLGGAIARGPESAYPHRSYPFLGEIQAYWQRDSQRERLVAAVNAVQGEIGSAAHYRNYPDPTLKNWETAYYGESYPKLQELKQRYDPDDLFRHSQSVRPSAGAR
ncbi:FAD-binding oxidoreductase [Roseibacillus persicicus]|uniref:FAD-binding protein n=2 Tax=Roseibacillus persicicus TaxID=454148 RepID=A0A918TAT5_9BACT|nr:FAD-binding oxidoreductase [Roseibacillus persicicus]GHC40118.1 FAD-binding protein [Roseibacillus persicicus]